MPPRKQSEDKSFKPIDPKVRREQIGLSKLNEVDDGELKKIKNGKQHAFSRYKVIFSKYPNPRKLTPFYHPLIRLQEENE